MKIITCSFPIKFSYDQATVVVEQGTEHIVIRGSDDAVLILSYHRKVISARYETYGFRAKCSYPGELGLSHGYAHRNRRKVDRYGTFAQMPDCRSGITCQLFQIKKYIKLHAAPVMDGEQQGRGKEQNLLQIRIRIHDSHLGADQGDYNLGRRNINGQYPA